MRRDVLNVALGNRDNHLRNTALQRFEDGTIRLTPLFDFAPMMLHPDGIARSSRWEGEQGALISTHNCVSVLSHRYSTVRLFAKFRG